jgi:hypothetical protein
MNEFKEKGNVLIDILKLNFPGTQYIYVLEKEDGIIEGKLVVY